MLKLNEKKKMGWKVMGCYWIGGSDWIIFFRRPVNLLRVRQK